MPLSRGKAETAGAKATQIPRHRFQTEVHLGILGIIFLLLFLNFASNYLILNTRSGRKQAVTDQLENAARATGQILAERGVGSIIGEVQSDLMQRYRLTGLTVFTSAPVDDSPEARRAWFSSVVSNVPAEEIPALAERLLEPHFGELSRGIGGEYHSIQAVETPAGRQVIALSCQSPELARLDDIYRLAILMAIIALTATAAVYVLLSRLIFAPFRRVKQEAQKAGRAVDQTDDDVDALLTDYRRMIEELCLKERELIDLNALLSRHADSLEQFNRYLLESMRSGLVTIDRLGIVKAINGAACRMVGTEEIAAVDKPYTEILTRNPLLTEAVAEALSGQPGGEYREVTSTSADGTHLTLGATASVVTDRAGTPIGAALILHDITEVTHLRAELEIRHRLAALGEMSGGLAHQLRNSMGAISGYLTLLKRRLGKRGIDESVVTNLISETGQANLLVRRFLEFARPLQLDPRQIRIDQLVRDAVETFRMRPDHPHIAVAVGELPEQTFEGDPLLLKQALVNLIENAANAYGSTRNQA